MKLKYLAAAALAVAGVSSQAVSLFVTDLGDGKLTEPFNNISGMAVLPVGTTLDLVSISATGPGKVTATYLGQESGAFDSYMFTPGGGTLTEFVAVGTTISKTVAGGLLPFSFADSRGGLAPNGPAAGWSANTSIGLIATNQTVNGKFYELIIGYNDSAGTAAFGDWDDYVVGLNIAPIPEPETYALLLGGLGMMGFMARRRRAN